MEVDGKSRTERKNTTNHFSSFHQYTVFKVRIIFTRSVPHMHAKMKRVTTDGFRKPIKAYLKITIYDVTHIRNKEVV